MEFGKTPSFWYESGIVLGRLDRLKGANMAIVRHLDPPQPSVEARHTGTTCTYSVVRDEKGAAYLQIDTYGSSNRQIPGKKSQSIRFASQAVGELKQILRDEFPS